MTYPELKSNLSELYAPACCSHEHPNNLAGTNPEDIILKMVMDVWRNKKMPNSINVNMTKYFAQHLWNRVEEGYGQKLAEVDYDTPDFIMLRKMKESVFHFSAAKNYQQLKALSQALINSDGKLRTFSEFRVVANQINNEHVNTWLKAEYDMAVCTGQASADWVRIIENKDVLPNLKFDAVIDGRTTDICRSLDGVIRPVDDSFWDIYYIPNHWGERSLIRQIAGGKLTSPESIVTPEKMPAMFKTNLAKGGLVFPPLHPYYIGLPSQVKEQADALLREKPKRFKTIKEAEKFAIDNGLAKKVSFKGLNHVDVANDVNEVLLELKKDGITYDEIEAKTSTRKGQPTYIMANEGRFTVTKGSRVIKNEAHKLLINKAYFNKFETYDDITKHIKGLREKKWTTPENVKGLVWHEVGHRLTERKLFEQVSSKYETPVFDYDRLGKYATKNINETLAEIYAYFKKTGEIDEAWKVIFNKWTILPIK